MDVGRFLPLKPGSLALIEFIRAEIQKRGPVSFAWFMEQALYHPQHGYYSSGRASIGRKGDYFTNVSVGPLFGQLLAAQFAEMWERLGKIDNFTIVEQGAHDGEFARDVLSAIRVRSPEFFSTLRYRIVEPFRVWQDRQSQTLESFDDKVEWNTRAPFVGVHFSNELLDAMPVHLSGKFVGLDHDNFVFVEQPPDFEIKPATIDWIDNLSTNLQRGFVIAIDYGFPADQFHEVLQCARDTGFLIRHSNKLEKRTSPLISTGRRLRRARKQTDFASPVLPINIISLPESLRNYCVRNYRGEMSILPPSALCKPSSIRKCSAVFFKCWR